jgi:ribonucleotide monophosphatase NagD (HAD superfamily)
MKTAARRLHRATGTVHTQQRRAASTWGCALDIDGVMLRGGVPVRGAAETVRQLQRDGIPHVFLTNGSGTTEQQKADSLSRILGLDPSDAIPASNMQLASTPMRQLAQQYKDDLCLFVGKV